MPDPLDDLEAERQAVIQERAEKNAQLGMEGESSLSWTRIGNQFVVARDRTRGFVLLGGFGTFGLGQMWVEDHEDRSFREDPTYELAPEQVRTCQGYGPFIEAPAGMAMNVWCPLPCDHEGLHRVEGELLGHQVVVEWDGPRGAGVC